MKPCLTNAIGNCYLALQPVDSFIAQERNADLSPFAPSPADWRFMRRLQLILRVGATNDSAALYETHVCSLGVP